MILLKVGVRQYLLTSEDESLSKRDIGALSPRVDTSRLMFITLSLGRNVESTNMITLSPSARIAIGAPTEEKLIVKVYDYIKSTFDLLMTNTRN